MLRHWYLFANAARGRVFLAEFVHASCGVHDFLLTRIERMAVGADFNLQVMPERRAGFECIAAGASDRDLFVLRMRG